MNVCEKCGDEGDLKCLIHCVKCKDSAQHGYCMDKLPKPGEDIDWICEDCCPKPVPVPSRKSDRINMKKGVRLNRLEMCKHNYSPRTRCQPDKLTELKQPVGDFACPEKEIKNLQNENQNLRDQEFTRRKRRSDLEDGEISDRESEQGEVEASELPPNEEVKYFPNEEINCVASNNISDENKRRRQRRRLVWEDEEICHGEFEPVKDKASQSVLNASCSPLSSQLETNVHAKTFTSPIWRGSFRIGNEKNRITFALMAYISCKASPKVTNAASTFPELLNVETLSRLDAWPKNFKDYPPTEDSIGLYLFPANEKDEKVYDGILDDIITQDLALKAVINNIELLVFSSRELPEEHWRICRKYYMWAVCKSHKVNRAAN